MPKVYSKRKSAPAEYRNAPPDAVLVDRTTDYGNPFIIGKHGDRTIVLKMFLYYAHKRLTDEPDWLDPLIGKDLLCWCAPEDCHADVLIRMAHERHVQLTILEVVSDEWMTIPEIEKQVALKLGVDTHSLGNLVAYHTGHLIGKDKLENKQVTPEGSQSYYYMCRKPK